MTECSHFQNCSAPICPLDEDWQMRTHLKGERVCFYLIEYSKEAARPILRGSLSADMYSRIVEVYSIVIDRVGVLRRQFKRSSNNPPRVKADSRVH